MGTFELNSFATTTGNSTAHHVAEAQKGCEESAVAGVSTGLAAGRLRQECIIAFKVYDSCRQRDCNIILHTKSRLSHWFFCM